MADKPITRKELFLAKAGGQDVKTPEPITREERFLEAIANGGGGGGSGLPPISTETEEIIALQTLAFEDQGGMYGATVAGTFDIAAGDAFTVSWDGDDYDVTVFNVPGIGIPAFGNLSIAGMGADTGEPFFGGYMEGMGLQIIASTSDPTHEVGISSTVYTPANGSILIVEGGEWKANPIANYVPALARVVSDSSVTVAAHSLEVYSGAVTVTGVPSSWSAGMCAGSNLVVDGNSSPLGLTVGSAQFDLVSGSAEIIFFNNTASSVTASGFSFAAVVTPA